MEHLSFWRYLTGEKIAGKKDLIVISKEMTFMVISKKTYKDQILF